jgi:hypothetical protein
VFLLYWLDIYLWLGKLLSFALEVISIPKL